MALATTAGELLFAHRADERFAMCSTFKLPLTAQLLHAARRRRLALDTPVPVTAAGMVSHAPFTALRIGGTATLLELGEAAMVASDNPATNLILARLGGPEGFTAWVRARGDGVTRLERYEVMMSEGAPGDPRDTTSPAAMLGLVRTLLFGPLLPAADRERLIGWMHASQTGDDLLRAGLPPGWREGHKTGSGGHGIRNLLSLLTPPAGPPLIASIYMAGVGETLAARNRHYPPLARAIAAAIMA